MLTTFAIEYSVHPPRRHVLGAKNDLQGELGSAWKGVVRKFWG